MANEQNILDDYQRVLVDRPRRRNRIWIAVVVLLISASLPYVTFRWDRWGVAHRREDRTDLSARFDLDLTNQLRIDPELIRYEPAGTIALTLENPCAITSGPQDRLYVAGDQAVHILDTNGRHQKLLELANEPTCLAIGGPAHQEPGRIYVGTASSIEVFDANHEFVATWKIPAEQAVLTAIAVADSDVFVADAGHRLVWRFSTRGELRGQLGRPDSLRNVPGLVIPSPHFDIAIGSADLIHVVNPGKLQVATFSFDGDLGPTWGEPSSSVEGFFGCCNPAHIALLPDGSIVTSEKGIPRVKVYTPNGVFAAVVAGPEQLGVPLASVGDPRGTLEEDVFDIAADRHGRVYVLDAKARIVRTFQTIVSTPGTDT